MVVHSIERVPTSTTGFNREGWGVAIPSSVGLQLHLRDSLALEFSTGYADLEETATDKGTDGFWSTGIGLVIGDFGRRSAAHLPIKRFEQVSVPAAVASDPVVTAPDRDGDGLTDDEETRRYFTNPVMADSDADGVDDLAEVRAGTDPNRVDGQGGTVTVAEPK